jgi:hypothetical protein
MIVLKIDTEGLKTLMYAAIFGNTLIGREQTAREASRFENTCR